MRLNIKNWVIVLTLSIALFFICDMISYRYGRSIFNFYSLPMNVRVYFRFDFEGGSYIEDNDMDGMPLFNVGYKLKDRNKDVRWVNDFIGYGFEKDTLFVKLLDTVKGYFYIPYTYLPNERSYFKLQTFRKELNYKPSKWYSMDNPISYNLKNISIILILISSIKISSITLKRK